MRRVIIDNDALHAFAERPGAHEAARAAIDQGDLEIYYVHTTLAEAAATPDIELRTRLLLALVSLGKLVVSSGFFFNISRFDQAALTDNAGAATLNALASNNPAKHGKDALAAATAHANGWALVTNETRRLRNRAAEQGIEVLNIDDLLREVRFVHDLPMAEQQPELLAVPAPTRQHPGRCRVPTRYGAERPCPNPAEGMAADWTAPLDPAGALGACQSCAGAYGLEFRPF